MSSESYNNTIEVIAARVGYEPMTVKCVLGGDHFLYSPITIMKIYLAIQELNYDGPVSVSFLEYCKDADWGAEIKNYNLRKKKQSASVHQIAKRAGVSTALVYEVVHGRPARMVPAKVKRIYTIAKRFGYPMGEEVVDALKKYVNGKT